MSMNLRHNFLGSLGCLLGFASLGWAQPHVTLRLSFNAEQNQYEVLARPSFTAKNFTWGPSQISVVLPAEVANETLAIRSMYAGSWSDNSVTYAPAAASTADYHGITSLGGKLDLAKDEEYVLFYFSLKGGYVDNVRLYNEAKDPNSAQAGMQGGDFRSYMADERGTDYLKVDSQTAKLAVNSAAVLQEPTGEARVIAYPNPSAGGKFRLYLKGFALQEQVSVRVLNMNGVVLRSFNEKVETLGGRVIDVGTQHDNYVLVNLERQTNHQIFTQKLMVQ